MAKIVQNIFLLSWTHTVLVHSANIGTLGFELTDEVDMMCVDINTDNICSSYSGILNSFPRASLQNNTNCGPQNVPQETQTPCDLRPLDMPGPSNAVNTVDDNESSSASASTLVSLFLPSTSSAKRACDTAEKEDREHNSGKRQKTKTTATKTNSSLMDGAVVRMVVEKFSRFFGDGAKVISFTSQDMLGFTKDLAQRGLTSMHSSEIMKLCTASEHWLGHNVFWRILLFFMDTLSLEIITSNQLEDKKTIFLRNRISNKLLSECTDRHLLYVIAKCRDAERMEIECNLNVLEDRGTANVLSVLRWLLYHVKMECIGITCDLREAGVNSAVLGRQVAALTKEWRGCSVRIDSLALCFSLAQYMAAPEIVKECPSIPVLKIHFIDADPWKTGVVSQALKALLLHFPALEQLSVFGVSIGIGHIRTIASMFPQLTLLEIGVLSLDKLGLGLEEEEEAMPVFPGLTTLKLLSLYNYYLGPDIKNLACFFPSLKGVQIPSRYVTTSLIDTLSNLRLLRSLETVCGLLPIETAEYLLEKLPALECLSVGVKELGNKLVHALSRCTGMHTLILRGNYTAGFFSSLLQASPLMSTLEALSVCRNTVSCNKKDSLSAEDKRSKKDAMKKFGCIVETRY